MAVFKFCIIIMIMMLHTRTLTSTWSECEPQNLIQHNIFDDRTQEDILLWEQALDKRAECAAACLQDNRCVFFQYSSELSLCRAYPVGGDVLPDHTWTESLGYKTFKLEHRDSGRWGSACADESNCSFPNSECYNSRCRCKIGYSFNPKRSTCAEDCNTHGQYYSEYMNRVISGHDTSFSTVSSMTECLDLCSQTDNCRSVDYNNTHCFLQAVGWIQVKANERGSPTGWRYAHRQCRN